MTYQSDKTFLEQHLQVVELSQGDKKLLVTPTLQGRVMTSCAGDADDYSFGWLNYDLISSGKFLPHCNNFGGEDRYWLGPEGGQYAIFFKPETGRNFDFEDWQAPSLIDTDAWNLVSSDDKQAVFTKDETLTNWSDNALNVRVDRTVTINSEEEIQKKLEEIAQADINLAGLDSIGFESANTLTNVGESAWTKETGALSIWILGQFIPSDQNKVVFPIRPSETAKINDVYFGKIDADRLELKDNCYYFRGDGSKRGKIGIPPEMTIPVVFSLDEEHGVLTIVRFTYDAAATDYINSLWEYQDAPYQGDVINSYNDGPLEDGSIMGPFYEIETSSKALFLAPQEQATHVSETMHLKGDVEKLRALMQQMIATLQK